MPKLSTAVPKYRKHRASGKAVVTINGRDYYLGPHGTKASKLEYDRLINQWLVTGRDDNFGLPEHETAGSSDAREREHVRRSLEEIADRPCRARTVQSSVAETLHLQVFDITGRAMNGWVLVEPDGVDDDRQLQKWIGRAWPEHAVISQRLLR